MKWTVASALETKGELGWGMKFVVCVRVRLTQGTVDNHGVRRGVLANGFVRVEDLRAGGTISRVGWGKKRVWAAGVGGSMSPVDRSTSLQLRLAKFPRTRIHFEGWRCFDVSPPGQLS